MHEYHAAMAMQEHHRRVGEVTRRAHLHPHARRPSWWARLRRRAVAPAPPAARPPLPGTAAPAVARLRPALSRFPLRASDGQPG
jgi:hypothetical protein